MIQYKRKRDEGMIIVMAKVTVKPEKKADLLELAKGVIAETVKENGCVSYVLFDNPYDPAGCMFVEEWTDLDALRAHAASAHIAEWRKQSADFLADKTKITLYEGEKVKM